MLPVPGLRNCGICAPPPGTRRRWRSPWRGWWWITRITHRLREASQLASEAMALIESIGDPTLTVGLSQAAILAKLETAEVNDVLRWSQRVIDLADGDPRKATSCTGPR